MIDKPKKAIHIHNSIPCYFDGLEDGCEICIRNKAIDDCTVYYEQELAKLKANRFELPSEKG